MYLGEFCNAVAVQVEGFELLVLKQDRFDLLQLVPTQVQEDQLHRLGKDLPQNITHTFWHFSILFSIFFFHISFSDEDNELMKHTHTHTH